MAAETKEKKDRDSEVKIPKSLPVLPLRDMVVYPFIISPLSIARETSIKAVDVALSENRMVLLLAQKDKDQNDVAGPDLYEIGTVAVIMRMLKLPDGRIRVLVQGVCRARAEDYLGGKSYLVARIDRVVEPAPDHDSIEREALMRGTKKALERSSSLGKTVPSEVMVIANNLEDPGRLADLVASNLELKVDDAQGVLEVFDPIERLKKVSQLLKRELDLLTMQQEIDSLARDEIDKSQREYFLRQQMKAIQHELGEGNELAEEIERIRQKVIESSMPVYAAEEVEKQLKRLERMHPDSSETATLRNYIEWLSDLPWGKETKDVLDLKAAKTILDHDHFGLDKIKERILEYLSVRKLKPEGKGPILCFVGPPGVGKTSLGRSIARALGRNFVRISLGGVRDEAEVRGHRRTYVGAMPGRIIQGIKQAGSNNPVFMLDEIDKVGADFRGDPSAALLEVLDPEQNHAFSDHYLNLPFDLSNVLFICTANLLDPIPAALADRMEVIQLSGYTNEEKLAIARKYLIPRQFNDNGISTKYLEISNDAVLRVIAEYTKEAGLRNLEREIASICRKVARKVAEGKKELTRITRANIHSFLGAPKFLPEAEQEHHEIGVATGLAWTSTGGEVLYVEASLSKGRGNLTLTGQLGDVMKESAQAAVSYARAHAAKLGIEEDFYQKLDIHIHVPAGAIPKDGPSAGITMATALISALTKRPVSRDVAMTGEITLRGRVLPIGGLKEKCLAAFRAGIKTVIVPDRNKKDLDEIPKPLRRKLHWVIAENMSDVLQIALLDRQNGARKTKYVSTPKTKSRKGKSLKRERQIGRAHV